MGHVKNTIPLAFFAFVTIEAFAGVGPNNIGSVNIGMSKYEYISAIGITPYKCKESDKKELKYIDRDYKTLCPVDIGRWRGGSADTINVGDLSYDVIIADRFVSKFIDTIGENGSKAIFLEDRLISLEISAPRVNLETLITKYGEPQLDYNLKPKTCTDEKERYSKYGKIFHAVWFNGEVRSTYRTGYWLPFPHCVVVRSQKYVLDVPKKTKLIEDAIDKYQDEERIRTIKDSPF